MPTWSEILIEFTTSPNKDLDGIRRKYLGQLAALTERNVIAFYSGWLQKTGNQIILFFYFRRHDAWAHDGR
jgi:hypothetical protein